MNGQKDQKAGHTIPVSSVLSLEAGPRYVSRGGEKLQGALNDLKVKVEGRICLDVGSSTGGFTDCLLQHGAKRVYAVDVGHHQLDDMLRKDPRVVSIEDTHILSLEAGSLSPAPSLAVIDVSFISTKKVLERVGDLIEKRGEILAMVKPQFEVGSKYLKKGVVKSEEVALRAVADVIKFAESLGFSCTGPSASVLKGPKGNQEYFIHLSKPYVHI